MNKILRTRMLIAGMVGVVTFIVFIPALQNKFINWDDNQYVYDNPFIRSFDMRLLKAAFFGFHAANWHPLTWLSHALDYSFWGLNPLGHHLTNNILHAFNTAIVVFLVMHLMEVIAKEFIRKKTPPSPLSSPSTKAGVLSRGEDGSNSAPPLRGGDQGEGDICGLTYGLLRKTKENNAASQSFLNNRMIGITGAVTGLLFGLHPLHVESVAWVAERKDLLCAFFFLLSLLTYSRYAVTASGAGLPYFRKQYLLTLGFFILALLSKPMAVTLPLVLLMLDWYPFRRIHSPRTLIRAIIEKLPFLALSLISSLLTILAQKTEDAMAMLEYVPLSTRLLVGAHSLITYMEKMIAPFNLVPFYPYPKQISALSLEYTVPIVLLAGITAACLSVIKRQKIWLTAWVYYLITLLPVIGIIQVGGQARADRYTYLPSLGPFLIIGVIAAGVYDKVTVLTQRRMILRTATLCIALAMLMSISYATVRQIGIWKDKIIFWSYVIEKEPEKVPVAYNNLGNAYLSKGLLDMAIEQYQTALRLLPNSVKVYNNLGNAYLSKGLLDMAIEQYRMALRLQPDYAEAHNNLGNAYIKKDLHDMAIEQLQTALRLQPDYAEAHNNLGNAYSSKGLLDMAEEQYRMALRLKPDSAEIHNNLGNAYLKKGLYDMAKEQYRMALRLKPDAAVTHFNLGLVYLNTGSADKARTEFELALKLNPDYDEARQLLEYIMPR